MEQIEISRFTSEEFESIAAVLRGAYVILTADGEEDELVGDFIAALEQKDTILCEDNID